MTIAINAGVFVATDTDVAYVERCFEIAIRALQERGKPVDARLHELWAAAHHAAGSAEVPEQPAKNQGIAKATRAPVGWVTTQQACRRGLVPVSDRALTKAGRAERVSGVVEVRGSYYWDPQELEKIEWRKPRTPKVSGSSRASKPAA